jgi:hypothetical protein
MKADHKATFSDIALRTIKYNPKTEKIEKSTDTILPKKS